MLFPFMAIPWLVPSIVVGLALMLVPPVLANFQAGKEAFDRGDYNTALKEWRPLAEQGNASAQFKLWVMYHQGLGVTQDDEEEEAVLWQWRGASDQATAKGLSI